MIRSRVNKSLPTLIGMLIILTAASLTGCTKKEEEKKAPEKKAAPIEKKPLANISYDDILGETPEEVWPDEALKDAFARYWGNRFSGTAKEGFKMEAPHFQDLVSEGHYTRFTRNAAINDLRAVRILGIDDEGEYLRVIKCKLILELPDGQKSEAGIRDRWVFVGDRWYHLIKDPFFFPL